MSPAAANARLLMEVVPAVMWVLRTELRREQPAQLAFPHVRLLMCLCKCPGISLSELAEHLGLLPSSTSKLIDHLVSRGLVTRKDAPDDRRRAVLEVTKAGNETLEIARRSVQTHIAERLSALSPADHQMIREALDLLCGALLPDTRTACAMHAATKDGEDRD